MKPTHLIQIALIGLVVSGCSSISSTHVERDKQFCGWKTTHLHGTPITLSVPHHYKITIIDTYWEKGGNVLRDTEDNSQNPKPICSRDVKFEVEDTQEIFTVDFVKPGAGTLKTTANFDAQYFTSIDNKIVDTTIEEITKSIKTLSSALAPVGGSTRSVPPDPSLTAHPRVVAVAFIEVADPQAKEKIHDFLCQHLNSCNGCCPEPNTVILAHPHGARLSPPAAASLSPALLSPPALSPYAQRTSSK